MQRLKLVILLVALTLVATTSPEAFAWGRVGHQMVARIAEYRIAPATRTKILNLLQQDPGDPPQVICGSGGANGSFNLQDEFQLAAGDPVNAGLVRLSLYADQIREKPVGDGTKHWHFADIAFEATRETFDTDKFCKGKVRPRFAFDSTKNCYVKLPSSTAAVFRDDDCSYKRIDQFAKSVGNAGVPVKDRIFHLKMLVHLVGDVHQPLHNAEWNFDVGGNGRRVTFFNSNTLQGTFWDLHKVWDTSLLERMLLLSLAQEKKWTEAEALNHFLSSSDVDHFARVLTRRIDQAASAGWFEGSPTPKDWAWEAHELAVKFSYNGAKKNFQSAFDGSGSGVLKIDDKYLEAARPALMNQIMRAGYRLGNLLDQAFGT